MALPPVVQAIFDPRVAGNSPPEVQEAMLLGSYLEGGWSPPYTPGDHGTAFGPYQIHISSHPNIISRERAEDPILAGMEMWSNYVRGYQHVPVTEWITDPERAAEEAAVFAEAPLHDYYTGQGRAAVDRAWAATIAAMQEAGKPLGAGGAGPRPPGTPPGGGAGVGGSAGAGTGGTGTGIGGGASATVTLTDDDAKPGGLLDTFCKVECAPCKAYQGAARFVHVPNWISGVNPICAPCKTCGLLHKAGGVGGIVGGITDLPRALSFIFSVRMLELLAGVALILVGVAALSRSLGGPNVPTGPLPVPRA